MMRLFRSWIALSMGTLLMVAAGVPLPAWACAAISVINERVEVVDEAAVIVWDAATHQERFIRRASFDATGRDFGFLVPTPSVPTLAEANESIFHSLEHMIEPRVIEQKEIGFTPYSLLYPRQETAFGAARIVSLAGANPVQVLDTQHVAGYDAVVLSADNAEALRLWLGSHGYAADPALLAWLTPYIQAHWKITAFKISKENPRYGYAFSSAVSMTFTSDRPFFPYREPANQRTPGSYAPARSLRVFLLSTARMDGTLGGSALSSFGHVVFAHPVADEQRRVFKATFSIGTPPSSSGPLWLTTFEDRSAPRPGTDDVYFAPAAQQTPVEPPPIIVRREQKIKVPLEPFVLVTGIGAFFGIKRQRRTARRGTHRSDR